MRYQIAEPGFPLTPEQQLAVDPTDSKIVTAGAGSGKTSVLTRRYLLYLASGIRPGEIVAITFTKKAAREMRERIAKAVARELSTAQEKDLEYWKEIRDELSSAQITTIHGFYASLLRDYPLETGIDPGFTVLDEIDAALLRKQTAVKLMQSLGNHSGQELLIKVMGAEALEEEGGLAAKLMEVYTSLVNRGLDPIKVACALPQEDWRQCIADFLALVAEEDHITTRLVTREDLTQTRAQLTRLAPYLDLVQNPVDLLELVPVLMEGASLGPGNTPALHKDFMKRGAGLCQRLLSAGVAPLTSEAFRELLCLYSQAYSQLKADRVALDFNDLQFRVKELLISQPIVAREIGQRYRRFMVDEFQDTDGLQKEIIWLMVAENGQVDERLFIVGDEKQSIYRFRGADVGIFGAVRQDITAVNPQRNVAITANFRSRPGLIQLVNQLFSGLMIENEPGDICYQPLTPVRIGPDCSAELIPVAKDGPTQGEIIARRIHHLVANKEIPTGDDGRPASWGDIAILIRSRTKLPDLERNLRLAGIPYSVVGGIGFFSRPEIVDLINLLKVLASSLDRIALIGALRSPLFGVSDGILTRLAAVASDIDILKHSEVLTEEEGGAISRAREIIQELKDLTGRVSLPELLESAIARCAYRELVLTGFGGLQAAANIEKFLDLTRSFHSKGFQSVTDFLDWLDVVSAGNSEGEAVVDSESLDTVRIMTIHASKGLEFPVVVIPGAVVKNNTFPPAALVDGAGDLVPRQAWTCPLYKACKEQDDALELKEAQRLLYVAMTRARDYLVVTAQEPGKKEGENFNRWLWEFATENSTLLPIQTVPEPFPQLPIMGRPLPEPGEAGLLPAEPGLVPVGSPGRTFRYFSISQYLLWRQDREEFRLKYLSRWLDFDPIAPRSGGEFSQEPGGADFGSLLHRALELAPGAEPEKLLRQLVPAYFPQHTAQEREVIFGAALELLTAYLNQPAPLVEVLEDKNELVFYQRMGEGLFTGVIDKVLVAKDRVAVVDFKSNRLPAGGVQELVQYYRPQLLFYAGAAAELYQRPVEAWLQFLRLPAGQQLVRVEFTPQDIAKLHQDLKEFASWCNQQ